jgi:hypothetical protein
MVGALFPEFGQFIAARTREGKTKNLEISAYA